jgi:hypothetical protein
MGGTLDENQSSNVLRRNALSAHVRVRPKRRFWHVRFAGNLGTDGLYPAIVRTAEQVLAFA